MTGIKKGRSPRQKRLGGDYRRPPRRPIRKLLANLAALEKATRPKDGERTARGKDRKAVEALNLANKLVRAVAGWAIDHQMGLALQGQESALDILPELSNHPSHRIALAKVDDHRHEVEGARGTGLTSPILARKALLNLLQTNPGGFPDKLVYETIYALNALDYNEIRPIFQPRKGRRKVGLSDLGARPDRRYDGHLLAS